jgi:GntR family transcriptional regulator
VLGKVEETVRARQQEALLERLRTVVHDGSKLGLSAEALRIQFEQAVEQFFPELQRQGDKP